MISIRLSKQNKTIKLLNQNGTLRLSREAKTVKVVNRSNNIRLTHGGKTGPVSTVPGPPGLTGPTGVSTFVRVHHLANAAVARPIAIFVEWVGSVAPLNATTQDTWIHTP